MTHDQKEWAKTQTWFIKANQTLSGNWIVYVTPKEGETPDFTLSTGEPVIQFADYPMLLARVGF